jgi:acetylglutamate kinase
MKPSRVVIKLGGASLQNDEVLDVITKTLQEYRKYGYQVVLVHGGGPAINAELTRRGIQWSFVKGQRVTSPEMMDVIEGVLCGQINRKLVRHLTSHGLPAIGFSGADGGTLKCKQASKKLGQVGAITEVCVKWIEDLLKMKDSPMLVMSPIGIGENGEAYNVNADWAAAHLAIGLKAEHLIFLTDQEGILNNQKQVINQISMNGLKNLMKREWVTGGMFTKVNTVVEALKQGVKSVRVMNARDARNGLWSNYIGTWCMPNAEDIYKYVPWNNPEFIPDFVEVEHVAI